MSTQQVYDLIPARGVTRSKLFRKLAFDFCSPLEIDDALVLLQTAGLIAVTGPAIKGIRNLDDTIIYKRTAIKPARERRK